MPTIDEELVANSKAKFNADVNVKDFTKVKTEDGTSLTDYIDEHSGSVPENMVTTDTEQTITTAKHFKTGNYQITIGGDIVTKPGDSTALLVSDYFGAYYEGSLHIKNYLNNNGFDIYVLSAKYAGVEGILIKDSDNRGDFTPKYISMCSSYPITRGTGIVFNQTCMSFHNETSHKTVKVSYPYHLIDDEKYTEELAVLTDINKLTSLSLTKGSTNIFTSSVSTLTTKIHCVCSFTLSSMKYTFNFDIENNSTTCFNAIYGTTSDDITTCKAYVTNGTLSVDLDNISSTVESLECSYYAYN